MTVTAVIPNWNGAPRLVTLLKHLAHQTYPVSEIIVVDNGSHDGSAEAAEQAGAHVLRLGENRGFAVAVNRGIEACRTDTIAILNNDVELAPDWLALLIRAFGEPSAWFATGKIVSSSAQKTLDATFDTVCRGATPWRSGHGRPDAPVWNRPSEISMPPFTAAVFRRDLFAHVGKLDSTFESYLEDVDFGLRCAANGYTGRYVPEAVAWHVGSATLGAWHPRTVRQISRNQVLLIARHYPANWPWRYGWPVAVAQLLWAFLAIRKGCGMAWLRGKVEGIRLYRTARRRPAPGIEEALRRSERQLRDLQEQTGFDAYWRIYFALT